MPWVFSMSPGAGDGADTWTREASQRHIRDVCVIHAECAECVWRYTHLSTRSVWYVCVIHAECAECVWWYTHLSTRSLLYCCMVLCSVTFLCWTGCLTLLEMLEIYWNYFSSCKSWKSSGNFLAEFVCLFSLWLNNSCISKCVRENNTHFRTIQL